MACNIVCANVKERCAPQGRQITPWIHADAGKWSGNDIKRRISKNIAAARAYSTKVLTVFNPKWRLAGVGSAGGGPKWPAAPMSRLGNRRWVPWMVCMEYGPPNTPPALLSTLYNAWPIVGHG